MSSRYSTSFPSSCTSTPGPTGFSIYSSKLSLDSRAHSRFRAFGLTVCDPTDFPLDIFLRVRIRKFVTVELAPPWTSQSRLAPVQTKRKGGLTASIPTSPFTNSAWRRPYHSQFRLLPSPLTREGSSPLAQIENLSGAIWLEATYRHDSLSDLSPNLNSCYITHISSPLGAGPGRSLRHSVLILHHIHVSYYSTWRPRHQTSLCIRRESWTTRSPLISPSTYP